MNPRAWDFDCRCDTLETQADPLSWLWCTMMVGFAEGGRSTRKQDPLPKLINRQVCRQISLGMKLSFSGKQGIVSTPSDMKESLLSSRAGQVSHPNGHGNRENDP